MRRLIGSGLAALVLAASTLGCVESRHDTPNQEPHTHEVADSSSTDVQKDTNWKNVCNIPFYKRVQISEQSLKSNFGTPVKHGSPYNAVIVGGTAIENELGVTAQKLVFDVPFQGTNAYHAAPDYIAVMADTFRAANAAAYLYSAYWLKKHVPEFNPNPNQIQLVKTPEKFRTLLDKFVAGILSEQLNYDLIAFKVNPKAPKEVREAVDKANQRVLRDSIQVLNGTLAHEYAHLVREDNHKKLCQIQMSNNPYVLAKFSLEQEKAADLKAAEIIAGASSQYLHPWGQLMALEVIGSVNRLFGENKGALQTHPPYKERVHAVRMKYKSLGLDDNTFDLFSYF